MSRRLTYDVGASRHPLLMSDPIARDVLWWLADAAQERNDCRIIYPAADLAEDMDRPHPAVKHAIRRLKEAGLLRVVGCGDYDKRIGVLMISEEELAQKQVTTSARNAEITPEANAENHSETGATIGARLDPERGAKGARKGRKRGAKGARLDPERGAYACARSEQRTMNEEQGTENERNAGAPAGETVKVWTLPPHPVGDALLAKHNAAAQAQRAALASRSQPALLETGPTTPTAEPATAEATAAEARVQAAVEALLPDLREYHHAKAGSTASARIIAGWRTKLSTRLADDGVTAERIDARVLGIRAVLRWWRLPIEAEAKPGEPFCFYQPDLRSIAKLLDTANHLDKLIGWAANPRRKAGAAPAVRHTKGGVELGAPRYELETNPDGSLRW